MPKEIERKFITLENYVAVLQTIQQQKKTELSYMHKTVGDMREDTKHIRDSLETTLSETRYMRQLVSNFIRGNGKLNVNHTRELSHTNSKMNLSNNNNDSTNNNNQDNNNNNSKIKIGEHGPANQVEEGWTILYNENMRDMNLLSTNRRDSISSLSTSQLDLGSIGMAVQAIKNKEKEKEECIKKYSSSEIARLITVQKLIRAWLVRRQVKALKRRTDVVKELIQTEVSYIAELDCLIKHYVQPLRDNSTSRDYFILPSDVNEIFSTIVEIRDSSNELLAGFAKARCLWSYHSCISDVFLSHMEDLQMYIPYIVNYERAHTVVKKCVKNPVFASFMNERKNKEELKFKDLDDFMILPVQRIPRYIMLLESVYKYLPSRHPDKENTKKAIYQMRSFARKINTSKAAKLKLSEFLGSLVGSQEHLSTPTRYLVRDGILYDDRKRAKFCVLLNDLLILTKVGSAYFNSPEDVSKKKKYQYSGKVNLNASTKLVVALAGDPTAANAAPLPFVITFINEQEKHMFTTASNEEGKLWIKDIHVVLEHLRKRKKSQSK